MNKKQKKVRKAIKKSLRKAVYQGVGGCFKEIHLLKPDKNGESSFIAAMTVEDTDIMYIVGSMTSPELCRQYEKELRSPWKWNQTYLM